MSQFDLRNLFRGRKYVPTYVDELRLENIALRHEISVLQSKMPGMSSKTKSEIRRIAEIEVQEELRRALVEQARVRIRARMSLWARLKSWFLA